MGTGSTRDDFDSVDGMGRDGGVEGPLHFMLGFLFLDELTCVASSEPHHPTRLMVLQANRTPSQPWNDWSYSMWPSRALLMAKYPLYSTTPRRFLQPPSRIRPRLVVLFIAGMDSLAFLHRLSKGHGLRDSPLAIPQLRGMSIISCLPDLAPNLAAVSTVFPKLLPPPGTPVTASHPNNILLPQSLRFIQLLDV